jgi:RNA-directed DNA polymerase
MKRRTLYEIKADSQLLAQCRNIDDICLKLNTSKNELLLHSLHPKYYSFPIKKHDGSFREIEAPSYELKAMQKQLNYFLQALYFEHQTPASYGYIISPDHLKSQKNIVTNAQRHLGNPYMLSIDFEDFFHQIKLNDVVTIFSGHLLDFDPKSAFALASICTYNNRLPMGAPTSPVLSNLYSIDLDNELNAWAKTQNIVYTRFVDDLTFSSKEVQIGTSHFDEIAKTCLNHNLALNRQKTKFAGPNDVKLVTGLLLNKTVDILPQFYQQLNKDLTRLKHIYEASVVTHQIENNPLLQKFKQEVQGQINFIGMVEGYNSQMFMQYHQRYKATFEVDEEVFSMRWTTMPYI